MQRKPASASSSVIGQEIEQYVATAEIYYPVEISIHSVTSYSLGFTHSEASSIKAGIFKCKIARKQILVSAKFEVKHSYFQMLRRSIEKPF